jgi:mannosyltransferase OCH1-like enzyme
MLWTDETSRRFIQENYPWFLSTFDSYPYSIQRADVIRYFVLYHYGGFYVDLDIGCRRSFEQLRQNSSNSVILPKTQPIGFSNDWMAAKKGHAFLGLLISDLQDWNVGLVTKYPTVFFSTGPMFLNTMYCKYGDKQGISVLPDELYGGHWESSFVRHYHGSSWHDWDAALVFYVWDHWVALICTFAGLGGLLGLLLWRSSLEIQASQEYQPVAHDPSKDV